MLEQILQQIELYTIRRKELKKLKTQRYQNLGVSLHLTRDLNINQLNQISIKSQGRINNRNDRQSLIANKADQCKKPPTQEAFQLSCLC